MGSGELTVDLRGLAGMIGIQGDNGMGKTTFLELIQPHRMMVSRGSESLKSQIFMDAHKDLTFQIKDRIYRSLTRIKERTGKTEAFIWEDGTLMNENGNCDIHDEIVSRLQGTPEMFFASVFCAQKGNRSRRITELTKGERKGLIIQFMNLAQLEEWQATAKALRDVIATKRQEAQREVEGLRARLLPDPGAFEKEMEKVKFQIQDLLLRKGEIESWLEVAQVAEKEALARVREEGEKDSRKRAKGEENERIESRVEKARVRIKDLGLEQSRIRVQDLASDPEAIRKKIKQAEMAIQDAERAQAFDAGELKKYEEALEVANDRAKKELEIAGEEKGIRGRIDSQKKYRTEIQQTLGIVDGQKGLAEKLADLARQSGEVEVDLDDVDGRIADHEGLVNGLEEKAREEARVDLERESLTGRAKALSKQADILGQRPAECRIDGCAFIKGALDASKEISEIKKQIEALPQVRDRESRQRDVETAKDIEKKIRAERDSLKSRLVELEAESTRVSESIKLAEQVTERIKQIDGDIAGLEEELRNLPTPDSQQTQKMINEAKAGVQREKEYLDRAREHVKKNNDRRIEETEHLRVAELAQERIRSIGDKITSEESALSAEEELLKARRGEWEAIIVDLSWAKKLLDAQADLKKWRDGLSTNQRDAEGKRVSLVSMEGQLKADREVRAGIESTDSRIAMLGREAGEWDLLQTLCGRDHLQAYEIDASAPIITGLANDLLKTTFGDRFAIRFQTLKDGKEVFDVLVYDQEIGEEKDIRDISGGEEVWILKALRLAMTLLTKERSGKTYHTIFGDEEDGKLSIQNRMAYLQMYRKMLAIGGFTCCYLVSHTPELTEACDHRLRFRAGGIDVD